MAASACLPESPSTVRPRSGSAVLRPAHRAGADQTHAPALTGQTGELLHQIVHHGKMQSPSAVVSTALPTFTTSVCAEASVFSRVSIIRGVHITSISGNSSSTTTSS